jgi:hypothetical protein
MDVSYIKHGLDMLVRTFHNDPIRIIAILACASVVTFLIALRSDARAIRAKPASARNPHSRPPA